MSRGGLALYGRARLLERMDAYLVFVNMPENLTANTATRNSPGRQTSRLSVIRKTHLSEPSATVVSYLYIARSDLPVNIHVDWYWIPYESSPSGARGPLVWRKRTN